MLKKIRTYFGFTRKEQRGLIVLLVLIILVWSLRMAMSFYDFSDAQKSDFTKLEEAKTWQKNYEQLVKQDSLHTQEKKAKYLASKEKKAERAKPLLFAFDPNTAGAADWQKLGLSKKQAAVLVKYTNKGGRFYKAEDLKKVYVISDDFYDRIKDSVRIDLKLFAQKTDYQADKKVDSSLLADKTPAKEFISFYDTLNVELNSADSVQLCMLPGIGSWYAHRIMEYRKKLGGFYQEDQLLEVYGMDTVRLNRFRPYFHIDTTFIQKMDLNEVEFKELLRHPYMEYYIVKAIFQHKDKHGDFQSVADLKDVRLIYDGLYEKMRPYLKIRKKN